MFLIFDIELCVGRQNSVPNMWKAMLTNVPVEGGIVDCYVNGFFDGSSKVVPLCVSHTKVAQ